MSHFRHAGIVCALSLLAMQSTAVWRLVADAAVGSYAPGRNYTLEVARGNVVGVIGVNKFGRSTDVDTTATDIIDDVANAIWDAPTTARLHDIASSSASDDGDPVGVGARTMRVFGLTGWDTTEISEDIILNGITDVPTVNAYVIIHRMLVLTKGATSINVGVITATAQTDATITAQINADQGQTQMVVYGVPSTQTAYMPSFYATVNRTGGATAAVDVFLCVNPNPDVELINYVTKNTHGLISTGASHFNHKFATPVVFPGPTIIKMQATSSANNTDVTAGFDLYLIDN